MSLCLNVCSQIQTVKWWWGGGVFICLFLCVVVPPWPTLCSIVLPLILKDQQTMLGSGKMEEHHILPPRHKPPPSENRSIETIYGKLFNMSLTRRILFKKHTGYRVFTGSGPRPRPRSCQPSLCCPILHILFSYPWRWNEKDKNTSQLHHCF